MDASADARGPPDPTGHQLHHPQSGVGGVNGRVVKSSWKLEEFQADRRL